MTALCDTGRSRENGAKLDGRSLLCVVAVLIFVRAESNFGIHFTAYELKSRCWAWTRKAQIVVRWQPDDSCRALAGSQVASVWQMF